MLVANWCYICFMLQIIKVTIAGAELELAKQLFTSYAEELQVDLCFQSFEKELKNPLEKYGSPTGCLLLAYFTNEVVGCVALQNLGNNICEMKRMYVLPQYRKFSIGKALANAIINEAKQLGYTTIKLDTLQRLQPAIHLYKSLGFSITNSYYNNPLEEVVYMQKAL
jgi:putative acetyltransferase